MCIVRGQAFNEQSLKGVRTGREVVWDRIGGCLGKKWGFWKIIYPCPTVLFFFGYCNQSFLDDCLTARQTLQKYFKRNICNFSRINEGKRGGIKERMQEFQWKRKSSRSKVLLIQYNIQSTVCTTHSTMLLHTPPSLQCSVCQSD